MPSQKLTPTIYLELLWMKPQIEFPSLFKQVKYEW